jgi:nucleoside-diphosphate-sugar epimerase
VKLKYYRLAQLGVGKEHIVEGEAVKSEINQGFEFVKGDLVDRGLVAQLFEKYQFDIVVNLAAQAGVRYSIDNPDAYIDSNIIGFYNILEACRHNSVQHLIYASSSSVY